MFRFQLSTERNQVELIANGQGQSIPFQVIGPATEIAFVEELVEQHFGSLCVKPGDLLDFLQNDPWIQETFQSPTVIEGELEAALLDAEAEKDVFQTKPLGQKLVSAGVIDLDELEQLLLDYQPFAANQRLGEFLRLNLKVSGPMLELLINPSLYADRGFNDQRLGERLKELELISEDRLNQALASQRMNGKRLGEILANQGVISAQMAKFFSEAQLTPAGEIEFAS